MNKNEIKLRLYEEKWFDLNPKKVSYQLLNINSTTKGLVVTDQAGFAMSKKEAIKFCKVLLDNYSTRSTRQMLDYNLNNAERFHD